MKDKHLICLDLDGTLLTDDKVISPETKRVIKALQKEGHQFIISTGRPYRASQIYYDELELTTPVVNFNGAYVHHPKDLYFKTFHQPLDFKVSQKIFDKIPELNIKNVIAEVMDNVYLHYHDEILFEGFSMGNPIIKSGDLRKSITEPPTTILIQADESEIPEINRHLDSVYADKIEHRRWGAPYPVIEIVKKGISKATGVEIVMNYLGIPRENTIAFGDEDNDYEMIKFVGTGVAMDNGISELKNVADHVTLSHNDDGIGVFLKEYFNIV